MSEHTLARKFQSGVHLFSKQSTQLPIASKIQLDKKYLNSPEQIPAEQYNDLMPQAVMDEISESEKPLKNLYQTAATLLKYQVDKGKLQLNESTGKSLPKRQVNFDYKPLKLKSAKELGGIYSKHELNSLFNTKGLKPAQLLEETADQLSLLNKCELSLRKKHELLETISSHLNQQLKQVIKTFEKKALSAKNEYYSEIALQASSCAKLLINIYKQLYLALYQGSDLNYASNRKRANDLAFQLFDWICLEQDLCLALKTKQSNKNILLLQKLFLALVKCEPTQIQNKHDSYTLGSDSDIEQLFLRFNLLRLIDTSAINSKLQSNIKSVINKLTGLTQVISLDCHQLSSGFYCIDINKADAPKLCQDTHANIIGLHLAPALAQLQQLYNEATACLGQQDSNNQGFICLQQLIEVIQQNLNNDNSYRYSVFSPCQMALYTELENCYNHSAHNYANHLKKQKLAINFDLPANPVAIKAPCQIGIDEDTICSLQVAEQKSRISGNIGSPVILTEKDENSKSINNILGAITRIERNQAGLVELEVKKFGKAYTAAVDSFMAPNNKGFLFTQDGKYYLFCSAEATCWKGKVLDITLHDQQQWVICIKQLNQHFGQHCVYELF